MRAFWYLEWEYNVEEEPERSNGGRTGSVRVCKSTFYNRPSLVFVDAGYFRVGGLRSFSFEFLRNLCVERTDAKIKGRILFEHCA